MRSPTPSTLIPIDPDKPAGTFYARFPAEPDDIPQWTTSDATVVAISSVGVDGMTMIPAIGREGKTIIACTARGARGVLWSCLFDVNVMWHVQSRGVYVPAYVEPPTARDLLMLRVDEGGVWDPVRRRAGRD